MNNCDREDLEPIYNPIFHSEISSSYLIFQIFKKHQRIAEEFVRKCFPHSKPDGDLYVRREKPYDDAGAVDIYFRFTNGTDEDIEVLIETKVHDFSSGTRGQIRRYYEAAVSSEHEKEVYFIYLTQFNRAKLNQINDEPDNRFLPPPTVAEFQDCIQELERKENLYHITWNDFHKFMNDWSEDLSDEEKKMLELQKRWIKEKNEKDIEEASIDLAGARNLRYYFGDMDVDLKEFESGIERPTKNKQIYEISLVRLAEKGPDKDQDKGLEDLFDLIVQFAGSSKVDKDAMAPTSAETLEAARKFLKDMAVHEDQWECLSFYAKLFNFAHEQKHLRFNGRGDFSIKLRIKEKGEISLCTMLSNQKKIQFALQR